MISVAAPASGSANHTLEFWSVDIAGNIENPHKTVSFTVSNTTATIRLVWGDNDTSGYIPIGDSGHRGRCATVAPRDLWSRQVRAPPDPDGMVSTT